MLLVAHHPTLTRVLCFIDTCQALSVTQLPPQFSLRFADALGTAGAGQAWKTCAIIVVVVVMVDRLHSMGLLFPSDVLSRDGVHDDVLALLNEERDSDHVPSLQGRGLVSAAALGVALVAGVRLGHLEGNRARKLDANDLARSRSCVFLGGRGRGTRGGVRRGERWWWVHPQSRPWWGSVEEMGWDGTGREWARGALTFPSHSRMPASMPSLR